jgi:hypothetical protein
MDAQNRVADAPFNDTAPHDIILCSKDGVNFYVYKNILSLASPFFQDMFTLPQPMLPSIETDMTILVTEDSQTLDRLLRLLYPVPDPILKDVKDTSDVLEATIKYDMEEATALMRATLLTFVNDKPLQVYAVACSQMLEKEARAAAVSWKAKCPKVYSKPDRYGTFPDWSSTSAAVSYPPEMAVGMSAGAYFRLLRFVRGEEIFRFAPGPGSIFSSIWGTITRSVVLHPADCEDADIILRSSDGADFHVHKVIISLISPDLLDNESTEIGNLPIFKVPENRVTLSTLLRLCYPNSDPDTVSLKSSDLCKAVLIAAQKYKCSRAISAVKRQLMKDVKKDTLRVYFTAIQFGWNAEAREAAQCAASKPIENDYIEEMESMPAVSYRRLLKYCHDYRSVVVNLSREYCEERTGLASLRDNFYLNEDTPEWWHMGHQNASNLPAYVIAPVIVRRRSSYYYEMDSDGMIRESDDLAAKIEKKLSKVICTSFPFGQQDKR